MTLRDHSFPEHQGFSTEDILWSLGIWSAILTLTPAIVLMVA
jgi:hypothetical protein